MNKLMIIGNLTHDPVLRTVRDGISVCDFSVAVNRRNNRQSTANGQPEVDYFRVTAWRSSIQQCRAVRSRCSRAYRAEQWLHGGRNRRTAFLIG